MPLNALPIYEIDGRNLYHSFIAGAKKVLQHQQYLNKINVFPVNDGDTGSNMAMTVRPVIETVAPDRSFNTTAGLIAASTLENARGNSGIIFAQFLYGLSKEAGNHRKLTLPQFGEGLKRSVKYVYEAVANPVEGTMLTVIKDWSDFIHERSRTAQDYRHLLKSSREIISKSLSETKQKLQVLAKANVVDAGAHAFVLFVEGIIELMDSYNIRKLLHSRTRSILLPESEPHAPENVGFRYCTEGIIRNLSTDQKALMQILQDHGDSVVIGGTDEVKHVHVHTNHPYDLFHRLKDIGLVTYQKADDMVRQHETLHHRKWKIALVTDSTCDLPQELMDHYQVNLLPININFGESHYLDRITLQPEQFYALLKEHPEFPKTSQVNEKAFRTLYSQLAASYDSVISIHLTDRFSGTYHNGKKAAEAVSKEFNKPISVINSRNISGAIGLQVLRAAEAIDAGLSHDEIIRLIEKWIIDSRLFVSVKTLKYMVKGGRVSHTKGLIANLLNINPIVSMNEEGNSYVFGKTFHQKSNMKNVMEHVKRISAGRKIWNYIVLHAQNPDAAGWYVHQMQRFTGKVPVGVVNISPVIAGNAGIGAASIAFMFE